MHLLIGAILAGLAGKKKNDGKIGNQTAGLRRTGPVQAISALPGRIRLRVPSLQHDQTGCEYLCEKLPSLPGMKRVEVTRLSGSVLLEYEPDRLEASLLFAAVVRLLRLEEELDKVPVPILVRELRALGKASNHAVYEQTGGLIDLWSGLLLMLAVLGARNLMTQGSIALPAGFTMLWWSVNGLRKESS